ncbi:MAG: thiol:disulfide interchange protein [Betaproteobacteria bacterium RIFCSPLOWO2_12_FULL_62_13]|nr:MAG: thiol:disulfide interchange protein [Betaproteobacteria bacterium RIFCSPLOWO2_12_FULL_62_13]
MRFLLILLLTVPWLAHPAEPDLLEPGKAFQLAARVARADAIEVRYQIAPGYYMYRDKFRFSVEPAAAKLGAPRLPPGKLKRDEFFGEVETYRDEVRLFLPLELDGRAVPALVLTAISQGCADVGVCYVPQEQKVELKLAGFSPATGGAFIRPAPAAGGADQLIDAPGTRGKAEDALIAELFRGKFWLLVVSFFGFGLLLAFTPCMLPMVPILSGIVAGRGHHLTKTHGLLLSAAYVLGMAIAYALAGVAAGLSGAILSAALQNPWVLGAFAAVFVALALAMFGFYELQLPVALQTRLTEATNRLHGGHFAGVFTMGILSAVIVGPCVAAPLAGALLYISQSRDVVLGGVALFAMALGMGMPLLVVGASAGAILPKAGPWMETIKRFFGVLLLAVAIYLVSPVVPVVVQMLGWAALLIVTAIYLHALDPLPHGAHGFQRFSKGVGVIALIAGIAFLIGALFGSRDVLQPLSGWRASRAAPESPPVAFQRVNTSADLEGAIQAAAGKPVMLDFYADWCVSCKEMERFTFSDAQIQARLQQMVKLQADVTANNAEHAALLKHFRLFGPPGIIFFDRGGREIQGLRVIGFQSADKLAAVLDQVLAFQ